MGFGGYKHDLTTESLIQLHLSLGTMFSQQLGCHPILGNSLVDSYFWAFNWVLFNCNSFGEFTIGATQLEGHQK